MKRKYDAEFKRNTVQKVLDGQPVASVSRESGVGESLIYKWKRAALTGGNGTHSATELNEITILKKRNRELEMHHLEILARLYPFFECLLKPDLLDFTSVEI